MEFTERPVHGPTSAPACDVGAGPATRVSVCPQYGASAAPDHWATDTLGTVTAEDLANLAHLRRARDLMDREYARPLDVAELARAALMSTAHFSRQFRAAYGETPYAYLMTRRIERAKLILRRGELSVTEVCLEVGCTSLGSFSARFTELVGETPTAYRSRDHSELAAVPGCVAKDITRPSRNASRNGEARGVLAP
jgi:AraC-like DNA-binding protein